ncbi:MAG: hypothetical protein KF774_19475 [Planctomyces sp.]|nr:hypothetical protein [Planctomyces sp.]
MTAHDRTGIEQRRLWFGLLGGGIAWTGQLIAASFISEWGCFSGLGDRHVGGLMMITWLLIGVSLAMAALAAVATVVAARLHARWRTDGGPGSVDSPYDSSEAFLAKAGVIASGLFLFIIVAQSIPIVFFLRGC